MPQDENESLLNSLSTRLPELTRLICVQTHANDGLVKVKGILWRYFIGKDEDNYKPYKVRPAVILPAR